MVVSRAQLSPELLVEGSDRDLGITTICIERCFVFGPSQPLCWFIIITHVCTFLAYCTCTCTYLPRTLTERFSPEVVHRYSLFNSDYHSPSHHTTHPREVIGCFSLYRAFTHVSHTPLSRSHTPLPRRPTSSPSYGTGTSPVPSPDSTPYSDDSTSLRPVLSHSFTLRHAIRPLRHTHARSSSRQHYTEDPLRSSIPYQRPWHHPNSHTKDPSYATPTPVRCTMTAPYLPDRATICV